jgi:hypothetical protein
MTTMEIVIEIAVDVDVAVRCFQRYLISALMKDILEIAMYLLHFASLTMKREAMPGIANASHAHVE